jgi:hypothetical protein
LDTHRHPVASLLCKRCATIMEAYILLFRKLIMVVLDADGVRWN